MKKILILGLLITPIMAQADVGPSAASGTPVVATASAPYATASAEDGDSTTVVSASYVKGAYNDTIAAVNKVNSVKQNQLVNNASTPANINATVNTSVNFASPSNTSLVTESAVVNAIDSKCVKAVTNWGNDTNTTNVSLSTQLTMAPAPGGLDNPGGRS